VNDSAGDMQSQFQENNKYFVAYWFVTVESTHVKSSALLADFIRGVNEDYHLGDPGVDGRITLKWIFKMWDGGIDWTELAQDRDRWRALVNAVMNLRIP
jgi:hypothetical protein